MRENKRTTSADFCKNSPTLLVNYIPVLATIHCPILPYGQSGHPRVPLWHPFHTRVIVGSRMNGVDFASPSETLAPRPQPRSQPRTLALLSHAVTRAASPSSVSPLLACAVAPSPLHPPPLIVTPPTAPRSIQPPRGRRGSRRAVATLFSRLISKPPPPPPSSSPYPR